MNHTPEMLEVLKKCRSKFEAYAVDHHRKGNMESLVKAQVNQDMATLCDNIINKVERDYGHGNG